MRNTILEAKPGDHGVGTGIGVHDSGLHLILIIIDSVSQAFSRRGCRERRFAFGTEKSLQKMDREIKRGVAHPGVIDCRLGLVETTFVAFRAFLLGFQIRMINSNPLCSRIAVSTPTTVASITTNGFISRSILIGVFMWLGFDSKHTPQQRQKSKASFMEELAKRRKEGQDFEQMLYIASR